MSVGLSKEVEEILLLLDENRKVIILGYVAFLWFKRQGLPYTDKDMCAMFVFAQRNEMFEAILGESLYIFGVEITPELEECAFSWNRGQ